jgi:integrase
VQRKRAVVPERTRRLSRFRNFNRRQWKPVQRAVEIEPLRDLYDLRHTYATFALRAGVPVFALSRFMRTSIAMIDLHYGHLAVDSYQHAVSLLDALALERAVDAGWTPARDPQSRTATRFPGLAKAPLGGRWTLGGHRSHDASRTGQSEGAD